MTVGSCCISEAFMSSVTLSFLYSFIGSICRYSSRCSAYVWCLWEDFGVFLISPHRLKNPSPGWGCSGLCLFNHWRSTSFIHNNLYLSYLSALLWAFFPRHTLNVCFIISLFYTIVCYPRLLIYIIFCNQTDQDKCCKNYLTKPFRFWLM